MGATLAGLLARIFGGNSVLGTILVAVLPLVELKGAIPLGMSSVIWGDAALSIWQAFGWALLGSSLIVPVVAVLFRPIYQWVKGKKFFQAIVDFVVGDVAQRSDQIKTENQNKTSRRAWWLKVVTIFLFVAFPVPGTGVWTGTCFAILLGLNFGVTCLTVIAGNVVCGILVASLCQVFPQATHILLVIFLLLILIFITIKVILHIIKKRRAQLTPQA